MRKPPIAILEKMRSIESEAIMDQNFAGTMEGIFMFKWKSLKYKIISSIGEGWEHVSASTETRCPTWEEMCRFKEWFWDDEETVMQLHPPKSEWVNYHPNCLHLWKPTSHGIEIPPTQGSGGRIPYSV